MDDQYGIADLRHYISSRPLFPPLPHPPPDLLTPHRPPPPPTPPHPYDNMLLFPSDSPATHVTPGNTTGFAGFESGLNVGGGDGGAGRWPRQETLTLLEIRSRLDHKFKEANQKGPLWDEVSRIMSEEHGYQRSGKKCREKFENLYKYYKKTKEGKAGRQDGKHYRFFRQLEALYGDSNSAASASDQANLVGGNLHYNYGNKSTSLGANQESFQGQKLSDTSLSLSNYSDEVDTSSSDDNDLNEGNDKTDDPSNKKRGKRGWKVKIRDFIDLQMKKLMDKQEVWMEKMMKTMEQKEHERMVREEEWRRQDTVRMEKEQKFWANERAWIEARDAALMEALHKLTGKDNHLITRASPGEIQNQNNNNEDIGSETMTNSAKGGDLIWPESEISRLIQLRSGLEAKFQQRGVSSSSDEEMLWEEIATKMACYGHDRTGVMCKDKWDSVNNYLLKCNKKRKENSKGCTTTAYNYHEQVSNQGPGGDHVYSCNETTHEQQQQRQQSVVDHHHHRHANSSPNTNTANAMSTSDSCFRYFLGDAYGRIMD